MATEVTARLDPAIFRLPVERIRQGYYSDAYFVYTKQLLESERLEVKEAFARANADLRRLIDRMELENIK